MSTPRIPASCVKLVAVCFLWVASFGAPAHTVAASTCGDTICENNEADYIGPDWCPQDCYCGNGSCDLYEMGGCYEDCGYCGDSYCEPDEQSWCYADCAP